MSSVGTGFSETIRGWGKRIPAQALAVRNGAIREAVTLMQMPETEGGNMPVRSGFLQSSGVAGIGNQTASIMDNPDPNGTYAWDIGQLDDVLEAAGLHDTITFTYGASYAPFQNYGTRTVAPHLFVELAMQQWPQIVARNARAVKGGE